MKQVITVLIVFITVWSAFTEGYTPNDINPRKPDKIEQISATNASLPPGAVETISPAEFSRAYGAYLTWDNDTLLRIILKDIALVVTRDDTLYMSVANGQETQCRDYFTANQVNLDRVVFIPTDTLELSLWIRDFGPFYIYEDGSRSITHYKYWILPYNSYPKSLADRWGFGYYDAGNLYLSGGNFMTDGNRMGFCASVLLTDLTNKTWKEDSIHANLKKYLGLDSLVIIRSMQMDGTGHIDMAQKLLNDTLILVGEYVYANEAYGQNQAILNANADSLSKMKNLDGRPFHVVRIPMPPYHQSGTKCYARSYTNSLILNNKVLVPIYGDTLAKRDTQALNVYKKCMPDYEIIGINSAEIIKSWGAVHCITNTHFHSNPMKILHGKLDSITINTIPVITFRLNPGFKNCSASVYYKPVSSANFTEVKAVLDKGVFSAALPTMSEDFNYYMKGIAKSGSVEFPVNLPDDAPTSSFLVRVTTSSIKHKALVSNYIKLSHFPNPFHAKTTINYTVKMKSAVQLAVYNLKGRKLCSIAEGIHKPGTYRHVWFGVDQSGNKLSSGVYYLVTTIVNEEIGTIKTKNEMVIIR